MGKDRIAVSAGTIDEVSDAVDSLRKALSAEDVLEPEVVVKAVEVTRAKVSDVIVAFLSETNLADPYDDVPSTIPPSSSSYAGSTTASPSLLRAEVVGADLTSHSGEFPR